MVFKRMRVFGIQQGNQVNEVQTSPIYRNHTLKHLPQSTEPRAVLGSRYVMAKPTQFVKLSERQLVVLEAAKSLSEAFVACWCRVAAQSAY